MIGPRTTISPVSPTATSRHASVGAVDSVARHDAHLGVEDRLADAPGLADRVARVEAAEDRRLRLTEALLQQHAALLEGVDQLDGDRGAGGEREAQLRDERGAVVARVERAEQVAEHRRHAAEEGDVVLGDRLPQRRRVEVALQDQRRPGVERRNREDLQAERVEERHDDEHAVAPRAVEEELRVERIRRASCGAGAGRPWARPSCPTCT